MRNYRLVVMLKGDMDKAAREKVLSDVSGYIGKTEKLTTDVMGEKKLAYPVRGAQKADYVVMKFGAEELSPELKSRLEMNESVLRHLLVRDN